VGTKEEGKKTQGENERRKKTKQNGGLGTKEKEKTKLGMKNESIKGTDRPKNRKRK
jgi:hypothetical protein